MNDLSLSHFDNDFMYFSASLVGDPVSPDRFISC